jgi:hypothetical protein
VSLLGSNPLGRFELRRCHETAADCPFRTADDATVALEDGRLRCLALDNADAAADRLRSAATSSDDMAALRHIVATDPRASAWLSNDQVVQEVGYRIARRELCLLTSLRVARAALVQPGTAATSPSSGITPSQLRPAAAETPIVAAAPALDDVTNLNQAAQAQALESAARDGVPFCEECEKARQKAAASNAA